MSVQHSQLSLPCRPLLAGQHSWPCKAHVTCLFRDVYGPMQSLAKQYCRSVPEVLAAKSCVPQSMANLLQSHWWPASWLQPIRQHQCDSKTVPWSSSIRIKTNTAGLTSCLPRSMQLSTKHWRFRTFHTAHQPALQAVPNVILCQGLKQLRMVCDGPIGPPEGFRGT